MLQCGFYEADITPPLGASIHGYFFPRRIEGVRDRLFVKAFVIDCGDSAAAVVSLDILSLPEGDFCNRVIQRVLQFSKRLRAEQIILSATHSHTSGPREIDSETDARYIDMLIMQTADCIVLAEQRMETMQAFYGQGQAEGLAFIRNYRMKDGTVRTNPEFQSPDITGPYGEPDSSVPALYFRDEAGNPKGAIVNFACHHDCVHGNLASADYSGVLSRELKKAYGSEFICLFLNGFCANINNWDCMGASTMPPDTDSIRIGKALADTVIQAESAAQPLADETVAVAREVISLQRRELEPGVLEEAISLAERKTDDELPNIIDDPEGAAFNIAVSKDLLKVYRDGPAVFEYAVHALRIGDCVTYAVPGEVFSQFGARLKAASPTKRVMLAELSNADGECYIPPEELQRYATVYENHPMSRRLEPKAGDRLVEAALRLGQSVFQVK